jgi:hypothetical protein
MASRPSPLADAAVAGVLFLGSAAYFVAAGAGRQVVQRDLVGQAGFPRALALVAMVATALLAVKGLREWRAETAAEDGGTPPVWWRPWALWGVTVAYVVALAPIGFHVSTPLYVFAALSLLGFPNRVRTGAIALGTTAGLYVIFDFFLGVRLPVGSWFTSLLGVG